MMNKFLRKYSELSETKLLDLHAKGDEFAFHQLYIRHKDKLQAFFLMKCRNGDICNDLIQETFLKLLNAGTFKSNSIKDFGDYIMVIAFNTWSAHQQKKVKQEEHKTQWENHQAPQIIDFPMEIDNKGKIEQMELAITKLPTEEQVKVISLRREGHSYKKIAEIMGKTERGVNNLIYRAKKNLQIILEIES